MSFQKTWSFSLLELLSTCGGLWLQWYYSYGANCSVLQVKSSLFYSLCYKLCLLFYKRCCQDYHGKIYFTVRFLFKKCCKSFQNKIIKLKCNTMAHAGEHFELWSKCNYTPDYLISYLYTILWLRHEIKLDFRKTSKSKKGFTCWGSCYFLNHFIKQTCTALPITSCTQLVIGSYSSTEPAVRRIKSNPYVYKNYHSRVSILL